MSADDTEPGVPPVGEQIHVPGPSWLPLFTAVGLTLALIGVTLGLWLVIIGLLIAIPTIVIWIRSVREDISNLPPGH